MKTKKDSPCQPASNTREAETTTPQGGAYLLYTTPRPFRQERNTTMFRKKLKLVAVLFCTMFFSMLALSCWLWPVVIPYVLAPFAVAGAWKFCRVAYIWMVTDPVMNEEEPW